MSRKFWDYEKNFVKRLTIQRMLTWYFREAAGATSGTGAELPFLRWKDGKTKFSATSMSLSILQKMFRLRVLTVGRGRYQSSLEMPIGHMIIWPGHAQLQINLITRRKSSCDFIIYSRANPTFPIVKYRSFLFLFLLPIDYNVNKGCVTTANHMMQTHSPLTCVYIMLLCTL